MIKVDMVKVFGQKSSLTGEVTNYSLQVTVDNATDEDVAQAKKILADFNPHSLKTIKEE